MQELKAAVMHMEQDSINSLFSHSSYSSSRTMVVLNQRHRHCIHNLLLNTVMELLLVVSLLHRHNSSTSTTTHIQQRRLISIISQLVSFNTDFICYSLFAYMLSLSFPAWMLH